MKVGPYRIRIGHHDKQGLKIDWIDELNRLTSPGQKFARCSFYVPVLTPIVIALSVDSAQQNSDPVAIRKPIRVTIRAGSTYFSDDVPASEDTVRLYGQHISATPYQGKDTALVATEESIEITITDLEGAKDFATFEYRHLGLDKVPENVEVNEINYNTDLQPWKYECSTKSTETAAAEPYVREEEDEAEVEVDELMTSDDEFSFVARAARDGPQKAQAQPPVTPTKRSIPQTSLTPRFKAIGMQSTPKVKNELLEVQLSPNKLSSPAHTVKKDTIRKMAALERELKVATNETKTLGVALEKKEAKAKTTFDRAVRRAQEEYDAAVLRNREMKEELQSQLEEQKQTLSWIQQVIDDNTEVIELSDDSDTEVVQLSDDDGGTPPTSALSSPRKAAGSTSVVSAASV